MRNAILLKLKKKKKKKVEEIIDPEKMFQSEKMTA